MTRRAQAVIAHPARLAFVVTLVVMTIVGLASPVNLSSGEREDLASRRIFVPTVAGGLALMWLMPFTDRRDLWTLDGDGVRDAGVALLVRCSGSPAGRWSSAAVWV